MGNILNMSGILMLSACLMASCAFGGNNKLIPNTLNTTKYVTVSTRDNLNMSVEIQSPDTKGQHPAVLLLHMLSKDKTSWNNYIPTLLKNGYIVYSVDLRGHGSSIQYKNGQQVFFQDMTEVEWQKFPDDVADLVDYISQDKNVTPHKIGIVGASIGANSAIIAGAEHPNKIKTVVTLSPGLDYHGLKTLNYMQKIKIPVLIAVSKGDSYSFESSNQLNKVVKSKHDLLIYSGNQHGTNLLNTSEELQQKVVNWLNETLKQ